MTEAGYESKSARRCRRVGWRIGERWSRRKSRVAYVDLKSSGPQIFFRNEPISLLAVRTNSLSSSVGL